MKSIIVYFSSFQCFNKRVEIYSSDALTVHSVKRHSGGERGRLSYINLTPNTDAAKKISSHTAF